MDAFIAVLLSQLSSLTSLRLSPNFAKESQIVGMVLRSALCESVNRGLPTFQRLRDVSFNLRFHVHQIKKTVRNTADVLPFFYLPTVQRISASIDNPVAFAWPAKHAPTPSRLTSLDLTFIREGRLSQILSTTTRLKTLRWEGYYLDKIADPFVKPIIDLYLIIKTMSHVRDTLTDLAISAVCYSSQATD